MTNAAQNGRNGHSGARTAAAMGATGLILLGVTLQWFEFLWEHFASGNAWFFATLWSGAWNMIDLWASAGAWGDDMRYWPLLLVITGAAILFAPRPQRAAVRSESRAEPNRNA